MKKRQTKPLKANRKPLWASDYLPFQQVLSQSIVGHNHAIHKIAGVLSSHNARQFQANPPQAARVLLVGPSSSGKTFIVDQAMKLLNLHTVAVNAAAISPPGYRGFDISTALKALIAEAGLGGIERAQSHSCIIADEIDKIKRRGRDDDYTKQIEYALLPIFNGERILVENHDEYDSSPQMFSTFNTLIFAMGVFPEIPRSAWRTTESGQRALLKYGFCEEFVSRITHIIYLNNLTRKEFQTLLEREIDLIATSYQTRDAQPMLTPSELGQIADRAVRSPFGIRGARIQIHEKLFDKASKSAIQDMI